MPVILKMEHNDGQRSAVWEVREDESALYEKASLNKADESAYSLITNQGRRLEWLAVRALLKEFYPYPPVITYKENGTPALENCPDKISISHSGKMVAIALHPTEPPGIDIEMLHPRILKIAIRFLGEEEKKQLGANPSVEQLTVVWGAKEVMFKAYQQENISFMNDFRVKFAGNGKLIGEVRKHGNILKIPMEYRRIDDSILVQTDYSQPDFKKTFNFVALS